MFFRVKDYEKKSILPATWCDKVATTLKQTYNEEMRQNRNFEVFAYTHAKEALLITTLSLEGDPLDNCITFFISADLNDKINVENTLNNMIDSLGMFWDGFFDDSNILEKVTPDWEKIDFKKQEFHFFVSRENVSISLKANQLLGEEF